MWSEVSSFFREYMGSGLMILWFLLSALYLFVREQRKSLRVLFLYVPLLLLLIFFNPLFSRAIYAVAGWEGYYRLLWLIPFTVVTGYTAVQVYGSIRGRGRELFLVAVAGMFMVSGSYIYASPLFRRAENAYHMPHGVVEICDKIQVKGREVRAVFPEEMLSYVRQYTASVFMPYGREMLVEAWWSPDDLYDLMEAEVIDAGALSVEARENECHYIVLSKEKPMEGSLPDFGYEYFDETEEYVIYRDAAVDLSVLP